MGQSGGGKSTLFVVLQRFYDVQQGTITIDGQDIAKVTQQSLRQAISVVPQDIAMFQRSIMENIRYGRPNATDDVLHNRPFEHGNVCGRCRDRLAKALLGHFCDVLAINRDRLLYVIEALEHDEQGRFPAAPPPSPTFCPG